MLLGHRLLAMSTGSNSSSDLVKPANTSIDISGATKYLLKSAYSSATAQIDVQRAHEDQSSIYRCRRQVSFSERYAFRSNHSFVTVADADLLIEEP